MAYLRQQRNFGQLGDFWKHCGPALATCEDWKLKASKAVDELDSFYNRRGLAYLPQQAQDYYKQQIESLRLEYTKNKDCMQPGCGSPTNIHKSIAERATERLAEMQSDIDLAVIKQEEQKLIQAAAVPSPTGSPVATALDPSFLQQNKLPVMIAAGGLVAALAIFFVF